MSNSDSVLVYLHLFSPQVTYLLSGASAHEDFCGHSGKLEAGDLQVDHTTGPGLRSTQSSMDLKSTDTYTEIRLCGAVPIILLL